MEEGPVPKATLVISYPGYLHIRLRKRRCKICRWKMALADNGYAMMVYTSKTNVRWYDATGFGSAHPYTEI